MIDKLYIGAAAVVGVLLVAGAVVGGVNWALDAQYNKGDEAGATRATAQCTDKLNQVAKVADDERRRLSKIALDLGLELARNEAQRRQLKAQIDKESENEIKDHPAPAGGVCDWSDERVRLVNEAARGIGQRREGEPGSAVPGALRGSGDPGEQKP